MGLMQDVRFALRLLLKDRWFTVVAVITLALGIGVNTTVFTFVNAVLIRGLPVAEPERIMSLTAYDPVRGRDMDISYLDFKDWRDATRTFTSIAAFGGSVMNVSDKGRLPERFAGYFISGNTFKLLGQRPILGRDFLPEDDRPGAAPVVILGNGVWKSRYGSDPMILGRSIRVNNVTSTVIGVMPQGFKFPNNTDLWQPLALAPDIETQKRDVRPYDAFGLLERGVTLAQAQAEFVAIGARLTRDHPDTNKNVQPKVQTFNSRMVSTAGRRVFLSLMGAVAFVLLIACANVANLLLARSAHRSREIAVRVSLGATRWRIVRQLLVESLLLALISGVLALAVSVVGINLFDAATQDVGKPYWMEFTMDAHVFAFLAAVCLGTGLIFGLAPALHVSKTDIGEVLKEGGRSGTAGVRAGRWSSGLIIVELALTVVLLAGAGFMMRSFLALYSLDLGVETSHLMTMRLSLPERKYSTVEQRTAFYDQLEQRLGANTGIKAASIASMLPLAGGPVKQLIIDGRPLAVGEQPPNVTFLLVDARYFETLGVQLLRGKAFNENDGLAGHESAIVNQRLALMHFPNEDPVGKRIKLVVDAGTGGSSAADTSTWVTIVGVAPTVRQRNVNEPEADAVAYVPFRSAPATTITLLARTERDPAALTPLLREEVRAIDSDVPLFAIQTMDQKLAQQRWPFRVFGAMFASFAVIALLLSAVGLYAVTSYSVTQRTLEIGVRMALGAQPVQVLWLFLRRSFFHLGLGLGIGIAGAFGVGKVLGSLLVRTSGRDPATLITIVVLLAVVACAACLWPARRATRLDPLVALRFK